jgi:cellulose synthase/poly-beta-1,6-N-acetylglucosamine synthase-like glycosyltransferase
VLALKVLFWLSLGALAWTHVLYPLGAAALARLRTRRVRKAPIEPTVTVIVAAYNEEAVIERRLENLLALDYPADRVEVVVTSDASTDRTHELVERYADRGVHLLVNPRGGKVAAQDRAVRETAGEILAFSDANATWAPDALRRLVENFADPEVAYVCGQLVLEAPDGSNREGAYWRYEMLQREAESRLGSVTGGNGSIYAVRRADYVEVDPKWGHDLAFPYRMVQAGRRAVYEPAAKAFEKPTPSNETEYRRKVRMFEHCWEITLRGSMLKRLPPGYLVEVVSHRLLRYGSGLLHLVLLASSLLLTA